MQAREHAERSVEDAAEDQAAFDLRLLRAHCALEQDGEHFELGRVEAVLAKQVRQRAAAPVGGELSLQAELLTLGLAAKALALVTPRRGVGDAGADALQLVAEVEHAAEGDGARGLLHGEKVAPGAVAPGFLARPSRATFPQPQPAPGSLHRKTVRPIRPVSSQPSMGQGIPCGMATRRMGWLGNISLHRGGCPA